QRLQTDESARIQVTQYLIEQGVVDPADPALHANDRTQGQGGQYNGGQNPAQGTPNYPNNQPQYGPRQNGQQQPYGPPPVQQGSGYNTGAPQNVPPQNQPGTPNGP